MRMVEKEGGLSDRQFVMGKTRSTVGAINTVTKSAEASIETNKFYGMTNLHMKNVFHSPRLNEIVVPD